MLQVVSMAKGTIAFDIIGTCFSLEKPRQSLIALGAPAYALELWFAQTLRDAFALSHAGSYKPLKEVLAAELPRTMQTLGIAADKAQLESAIASFAELQLQPEALNALQILHNAGWQIVALTNGSEDSTRQLLAKANVLDYFRQIYSCDAIAKTKPHPEVYAMTKQDATGDIWLVAAHAWDIQGAKAAGLKAAYITKQEREYLFIYPQPDLIAEDLVTVADKLAESIVTYT
ncbi:HAD-IA family hydrolase [Aliterella atlantica]|nr:HAD-IA family hydrolase [Aliterella atlantica]